MKKCIKFLISTVIFIAIIFTFVDSLTSDEIEVMTLHATWANQYDSLESLVKDSDVIAVIKVEKVENVSFLGDSTIPFTTFKTVVVFEILGTCNEEILYIGQTGMLTDTKRVEIVDDPLMETGEEYLIFARRNQDDTLTILNGLQGRYKYEGGTVSLIEASKDSDYNNFSYSELYNLYKQGVDIYHVKELVSCLLGE